MTPSSKIAGQTNKGILISKYNLGASDAWKSAKKHWQLYLVLLLPVLYIIIFKYVPMYGAQIAFRDYTVTGGFTGSPWVGFKHFATFFSSPLFSRVIINTISISVYSLIAGFPIPIILAISINEVSNRYFKKTVQLVTYAPYFISTVVMVSMMIQIFSPQIGIVKTISESMGFHYRDLMSIPKIFSSIYVWSGIWQYAGYSSIIYIAVLSGADMSLYEAATVDGASKLQRIWNVDIPCILPTAIIMLIMSVGQVMNLGFEKIYLMQNPLNKSASDVISTYVYQVGLLGGQFSFSSAVGLFNSAINFILLITVNKIARKAGETSLW